MRKYAPLKKPFHGYLVGKVLQAPLMNNIPVIAKSHITKDMCHTWLFLQKLAVMALTSPQI